jgi:hypothetical protein
MAIAIHPLQESFNAGEFGRRMEGRVSFDTYRNAGSIVQNFIILPQGGMARRPGTRYIAAAKSASARAWLHPFVFSTIQAYILEQGELAMRFYRNQAQISVATTTASVSNGTFPDNITGWDDRSTGGGGNQISHDATNDRLTLETNGTAANDIGWAEQDITTATAGTEHVIAFEVVGAPGDAIQFQVGTGASGAQTLGPVTKKVGWHVVAFTPSSSPFYIQFRNRGSVANKDVQIDNVSILSNQALEITTPWSETDHPDMGFAQSADVIYFTTGDSTIRPYRLERLGHTTWSLIKVLFEDGPFMDENTTATTLLLSATSGLGINVTASVIDGINDNTGWQSTDVGRLIRWKDAANNWTWLQIVSITSTTVAVCDMLGPDASATTATTSWRLGEWSDARGWPSAVGFIQNRLGFAATLSEQQKFWLSESGDLVGFADTIADATVEASSSINFRFAALRVNTIQWMATRRSPIIGTIGGEWVVRSGGSGQTLLATDGVAPELETSVGVAKVQPVEAKSRLLYIQRAKRKLQEFTDSLLETGVTGFDSFDLTVLNDRVYKGGANQLAYQAQPDSVIWSVRDDGQVPTLTYQPDQKVVGWARQILGGGFGGGDAVVESVTTIPGNDGSGQYLDSSGRDEVWVSVKRTVNSATVRWIEVFEKLHDDQEDLQETAFQVDAGLTLNGVGGVVETITGITVADPAVVTSAGHTRTNGETIRIVNVQGFQKDTGNLDSENNAILESGVNGKLFKVANKATNTYELTDVDGADLDASEFTAYGSGGETREVATTISGLDHLEGEVVKVYGDGAWQDDKTVSSGTITPATGASVFHIGLEYEHKWQSLRIAFGSQQGTSVSEFKSMQDSTLVLMETMEGSIKVGVLDADGQGSFTEVNLRDTISEGQVPLFTGEVDLSLDDTAFDPDGRLVLKGTTGPCTILGVAPDLAVNEVTSVQSG